MKKFLIVGNGNAVTYKDIFPLLKSNKVWLGVSKSGMYFVNDGKTVHINSVWFTNLGHSNRHKPLLLTERYSPDKYPKYLNYDCIEVGKVKYIPLDYNGLMGVPLTFLDKYNPQQFEIVGCAAANVVPQGWQGMSKEFIDLYYAQGGTGQNQVGKRLEHYISKDGKAVIPYKRILIRRKMKN